MTERLEQLLSSGDIKAGKQLLVEQKRQNNFDGMRSTAKKLIDLGEKYKFSVFFTKEEKYKTFDSFLSALLIRSNFTKLENNEHIKYIKIHNTYVPMFWNVAIARMIFADFFEQKMDRYAIHPSLLSDILSLVRYDISKNQDPEKWIDLKKLNISSNGREEIQKCFTSFLNVLNVHTDEHNYNFWRSHYMVIYIFKKLIDIYLQKVN